MKNIDSPKLATGTSIVYTAVPQANWTVSQSKPEASFNVTELSIHIEAKNTKIKHIINAKEIIKKHN